MKENKGTVLKIKVTPRSSRNEISGRLDDGTIKIKLTAPPVEGKANSALVKFLAEYLKVSSDSVRIISGQNSHTKLISITEKSDEEINSILERTK